MFLTIDLDVVRPHHLHAVLLYQTHILALVGSSYGRYREIQAILFNSS